MPVELGQFVERQVGDLGGAVEPVQVGVVQGDPAERAGLRHVVAVHQRVGRRRDRLGDAERTAEPLRERRLAGAHLARQHDDVARARQQRDRGGDRLGVSERRRAQEQHRRRCYGRSMYTRGTRSLMPHTIS